MNDKFSVTISTEEVGEALTQCALYEKYGEGFEDKVMGKLVTASMTLNEDNSVSLDVEINEVH